MKLAIISLVALQLTACVSGAHSTESSIEPDRILSGLSCGGPLTGGYAGQIVTYVSMTNSAGDSWAQASFSGASHPSSTAVFYAANQKSSTFPVVSGNWTFSVTNKTLSVVMPNQTWTFPCTASVAIKK